MAFCGLANPLQFYNTLQNLGVKDIWWKTFPDHYQLNEQQIESLEKKRVEIKADLVITTQKDWIKLPHRMRSNIHWLYLLVEIQPKDHKESDNILEEMFKI